jgi:ATP-dependent phosphoenolpyruvate carboxykinase
MLAQKMREHKADAWLVNTGWSGGSFGKGKRISLKYSRAIIDAIHSYFFALINCVVVNCQRLNMLITQCLI